MISGRFASSRLIPDLAALILFPLPAAYAVSKGADHAAADILERNTLAMASAGFADADGIGLLHPAALTGALLHVVYHSIAKNTLFLSAGSVIHSTEQTKVSELRGIGQKLPITMWCFTIASVTLIGIPPMSAFYSKWYLAEGALASGLGAFSWVAPVILLVSALLTAGYLLPVSIRGFFPGHDFPKQERMHEDTRMIVPMLILRKSSIRGLSK